MQKVYPHGTGACIFVRNDVFKKIRGFDEKIVIAEDHDILNRGKKYGFSLLSKPIYTSVRRMEKNGRIRTMLTLLGLSFYRLFYKEVESNLFNYNKVQNEK